MTKRWVRQMQDYVCTTSSSEGGTWTVVEGTERTFTPTESAAAAQDAGETGEGFLDVAEGWRGEDGCDGDEGGWGQFHN